MGGLVDSGDTQLTVKARIKAVKAEAARAVKDEIKEILLEAGRFLLDGASMPFCVTNNHGTVFRVDLLAVIIPRGFDAPFLDRDVLMPNGIYHCCYCECDRVEPLRSTRHLSFSSLREYSAEDYMIGTASILSGIGYLKNNGPAVLDST